MSTKSGRPISDQVMNKYSLGRYLTSFLIPNKDEEGIIVRNKARLVAQGYNQEERICYPNINLRGGVI